MMTHATRHALTDEMNAVGETTETTIDPGTIATSGTAVTTIERRIEMIVALPQKQLDVALGNDLRNQSKSKRL